MTYRTVSWPFGGATFRESDDLKRHREKKKMFVRDRIEMLIDPDTPLLELSTLAADQTYEGEVQLRVLIGRAWCGRATRRLTRHRALLLVGAILLVALCTFSLESVT